MDSIKDFFTDLADNNLYIIIIVGAIILFAIIGFIADRSKKKKIEKSMDDATATPIENVNNQVVENDVVSENNETPVTEPMTMPDTTVVEPITSVPVVEEVAPVISEPVVTEPETENVSIPETPVSEEPMAEAVSMPEVKPEEPVVNNNVTSSIADRFAPFAPSTATKEVEEENPFSGLTNNFSFDQDTNAESAQVSEVTEEPLVTEQPTQENVQEPIDEENSWE